MLGFLDPRATVHPVDLAVEVEDGPTDPIEWPVVTHVVAPFAAHGRVLPLDLDGPLLRGVSVAATSWPRVVIAPAPIGALVTVCKSIAIALLSARSHHIPPLPRPTIRRDLGTARAQLVVKRTIPAQLLGADVAAHWLERLAVAKRLSRRQIRLIGVIPDVPLLGDHPVPYRQDHGTIAYPLPDRPVPLSTVVIARHVQTGEAVVGRFYRTT